MKNAILIFLLLITQVFFPQSAAASTLQPDITITPGSINFGSVYVGTSSVPVMVTLYNEGDADLIISAITIEGSHPSQFTIIGVDTSSAILAPGESAHGLVQFNPTSSGNKIACLCIYSNDPDESFVHIVMQGKGVCNPDLMPDITVDPESIDFGDVYIGTSSTAHMVTVTNDGDANLIFSYYGIGGVNASQFTITSTNATSTILPPGVSVSGTIIFTPSSAGIKTAYLRFNSNDPDENPLDVPLTGTGTDASQVKIQGIVFDDTDGDGVMDPGESGLAGANVSLDGSDNITTDASGEFSFLTGTAGFHTVKEVNPAGYRSTTVDQVNINVTLGNTYYVDFGDTNSSSTATIYGVVFDDYNSNGVQDAGEPGLAGANVSLDGSDNITTDTSGRFSFVTGVPGLHTVVEINPDGYRSTTPDSVNRNVALGNSYQIDFGDTNSTSTAAIFGIVYNDYNSNGVWDAGEPGLAGANVSLDGSDNITTDASGTYSFVTDVTGLHTVKEVNPDGYKSTTSDTVNRDVALGQSYQIDFGDVLEKPDISVDPMSINFDPVQVDSSGTPVTVKVSNHGGADLILGSLSIVGADIADFNIVSDNVSSVTLAPGQSANVSVRFSPLSTGDKEAGLQIPSNDEDESQVDVALTGSGINLVADLAITKTDAPDPVLIGNSLTYTLTVTNNGPSTANGINVIDALPAGIVYQSAQPATGNFTYTEGTVTWQIESLAAGSSVSMLLYVTAPETGIQITNTATVTGNETDPVLTNNAASATTTVLPDGLYPDITVEPLSIDFGTINTGSSSAVHKVIVSNNGTADLYITNLSISNSRFTISNGNLSGETLPPGASAEISLIFTPVVTGLQSGTLTISSNDPDENPVNVALSGTGYSSPGPGPIPPPTPPTTTTTTTPIPETTGLSGSIFFTVDFLGIITREPASEDGRPLNRIAAPDPDGIHLLEIEAGTGARDSSYDVVTLIEIRETSTPTLPANTRIIGKAYEFKPSGTVFDRPVRLTLGYNVDELPENVTSVGTAYYSFINGWTFLETEPSNVAGLGKVTAPVSHFTVFAVLAKVTEEPAVTPPPKTEPIPETGALPVAFKLSNLRIVPSVDKVFSKLVYFSTTGKEATISVDVTNEGGQSGVYTATLTLNDKDVETKEITLGAGETQTVSFTVITDKPGTYTVRIDQLQGEFVRKLWINFLLWVATIIVLGLLCWYIVYRVKHKDRAMVI